MAHVASYDIVTDGRILLSATNVTAQQELELGFPSNVDFGVRSVLSYMVDPGSGGVTFNMAVSNLLSDGSQPYTEIVPNTTLPSMAAFLRQEVIARDTLTKVNVSGLGVHKLRIRVTSGSAYFSDIVHLFQVNV